MSTYKQKFVVVMETGEIVQATVYGEDSKHGEGLAIEYAINETGTQVWDICNAPVVSDASEDLLDILNVDTVDHSFYDER